VIGLRAATEADRPFLFEVFASTRADELAAMPWPEAAKQAFLAQQFTAQDADYRGRWPDGRFLVVERDGVPVGRLYRCEPAGDELRLIDLALLPEARGAGIGTGLLADLLAEADARSLRTTLHVEKRNPARRLYDRLGFAETSEDGVYAAMERAPCPG
jgi:ribosomal protein S18 acetylase RimI-like enzyme